MSAELIDFAGRAGDHNDCGMAGAALLAGVFAAGPRTHDLRHTFAVTTLLGRYRTETDVGYPCSSPGQRMARSQGAGQAITGGPGSDQVR